MRVDNRIVEIDVLRGIAIVLMIIYHFLFDLNYFNLVKIDLEWLPVVIFQRIIGIMFLGLVGISLVISENRNKEGYQKHFRRALKLAGVAILITVATWIYPHQDFITFGIIHMIALSTLIAPFFFKFGKWNIVFGIVVIGLGLIAGTMSSNSTILFWLGIVYPGYTALDYYPMLPWFGIVLLGIFVGQLLVKKVERVETRIDRSVVKEKLASLGRNSLAIYLVHQLVLIGAILLLKSRF